jgi:hypothetical protein
MRKYRPDVGSFLRYEYGVALVAGLSQFAETQPHAGKFDQMNKDLLAQHKKRLELREPLVLARTNVRFAELRVRRVIRGVHNAAKLADGNRRGPGPIATAIFPDGLQPVTRPSGQGQVKALKGLINRVTLAVVPGLDDLRTDELPKLVAAQKDIESALAQREAAKEAHDLAFAAEKALRDQHYLGVERLMGVVRAAFPRDREVQETIFPVLDDGGSTTAEASEEVPGEVPPDAKPEG